MKIQLNSNGQIIDPPLRVAQRYINLGRAHEVKEIKLKEEIVEVNSIEPIPEQFTDFEEPIKAELVFDGIEIKPKAKVIKPKRKKAKVESNPKQEKELSTPKISSRSDSGYSGQYSKTMD